MLTYHFGGGPNPLKVSLLLEELDIAYTPVRVRTLAGEQHSEAFTALNPNQKIPVIVEEDGNAIFDSNAILLHLADRHGRFAPPPDDPRRGELLSWLMFVATGLGPFSGQAVHFKHGAPEAVPYAARRYDYEARRHFAIVERRLGNRDFLAGDAYSIADMALFGWAHFLTRILDEDAPGDFPNLLRLMAWIEARPAGQRALAMSGTTGGPAPQVKGNRHLFRHLD
ncbi:MAG TPA: glutathione S-transferase family protein [Allosphingosinicella sp.]|nr:glutathione S-transferase family protein [Allosphingosinicella sp.]